MSDRVVRVKATAAFLAVIAAAVALAGCDRSQADALEEVKRTEARQKQMAEEARKSGRGGAVPMFDLDR